MDPENLVELTDSDRRKAKSYNHWLLIWAVMFFGVAVGMEPLPGGIETTPVWRLLLAFSPVIPGILMVRAFIRFFSNTTDELIRKIHFEALAIGFLFAFSLGMCFELSAVIVGGSVRAGPIIFSGLLIGYVISLTLQYRKHSV